VATYRFDDMRQLILTIAMIVLSVLLSACVLLQQRGSGLGMAFGGDSNVFRTKRGLEKGLFYATIALGIVFMATAVLNLPVA
jgi:preprotein translocase subunit SecG